MERINPHRNYQNHQNYQPQQDRVPLERNRSHSGDNDIPDAYPVIPQMMRQNARINLGNNPANQNNPAGMAANPGPRPYFIPPFMGQNVRINLGNNPAHRNNPADQLLPSTRAGLASSSDESSWIAESSSFSDGRSIMTETFSQRFGRQNSILENLPWVSPRPHSV